MIESGRTGKVPLMHKKPFTMPLIQPKQQGKALIEDINATYDGNDPNFHLWWLGQSGFLLQYRGRHVLFDPYLSDSLTRKYADTDKPHVRMTERVIEPQYLNCIDIVTSSHNHTDHLDAETLMPLFQVNPNIAFLCPEANRDFVAGRVQCTPDWPIGLSDGESVNILDFGFDGIPAAHNELERDAAGHPRFMGYVVEFGSWVVYHSGDTLWHDELIEALAPFNIDVAILPINGNKPERRVAGNLDAEEAVRLGQTIGADVVIPCHYDMFTFNTADPQDFVRAAERAGQRYVVLEAGERYSHKG